LRSFWSWPTTDCIIDLGMTSSYHCDWSKAVSARGNLRNFSLTATSGFNRMAFSRWNHTHEQFEPVPCSPAILGIRNGRTVLAG
jgi:hypothetical protein